MDNGVYDADRSEHSSYDGADVHHEHGYALPVLGEAHRHRRQLVVKLKDVVPRAEVSVVCSCQLVDMIEVSSYVLEV